MTTEQVISVAVGVIGVPLVGFLKAQLKWSGKKALLLTSIVSVFLAILTLFILQQISLASFTWETVANSFGLILGTATIIYKAIQEEEDDE